MDDLFEHFRNHCFDYVTDIVKEPSVKRNLVLTSMTLFGKVYWFRLDHDFSQEGPTYPKVALNAMSNTQLVKSIREWYTNDWLNSADYAE